ESEDTSESDSECDLPSCDNFSPINVPEGKSMTFSNPLFDSNDDFTSSDDESLSDEDVPEDNVKIYSNPLFEFDDEYIFSDVNPVFNDVLEDIESKASYDSNLDEPALLVTPLFVDYYDSEGDVLYLESFLSDDTTPNLPPEVIQNGNSLKRTGRGSDVELIILPPTTAEEHLAVQRESKARTTLLQSIHDDHIADFHYMDDARDLWNAVKARFGGNAEFKKMRKSTLKQEFSEFRISETEGFHKGYDRMQKIMSQLNQLNTKPDTEEINLRFLRALPSSWSQVALTLKTKGGLEFLSFNDLYYKLNTLEVDVRGHNTFSPSQSTGPSHSAFVSATNTSKKMSYGDSLTHSSTTTYSVPSNSKTGSYRIDLEQIEKLDLEEMDLKWQMAMLSVRVHKFEQKAGRKIDFDKKESARFNKQKVRCYKCQQRGHFATLLENAGQREEMTSRDTPQSSDEVIAAKEFGMIAGCDSTDAIKTENQKRVLQSNQLILEDKIRVLSIELENTSNLLKHSERINADCETAKKDLQTKLDNHLVQTKKWRTSSKNLYRLIDSSMSVRTKVGLGFTDCISQKELGWDDFAFSVFTTTSEDVEGRPTFHRFAKTDSMKAVPLPLTGDYTSLSDHTDLDESQMSYGTKSSTSCDPKSMPNASVSCNDSDKSSDDNTNDLALSDSGLKSSEHKPNDSSCASTSSVSISVNEAEIKSHVGIPIKEPSIVQNLPSFTCNSSDKNEHTSRTSCNKNGSFNKKAGHFRKHASSVSKLCFVCGSDTHLIKDCDFYEKQMANKTVGIGVGPAVRPPPVSTGKPKVTPFPTGKPKVTPVPTGKPKVTPVPTGKPQLSIPVPTGTARPMPYFSRPTSSYFQTYTPYVPTMYYNHMKYGGDRWATAVKPLTELASPEQTVPGLASPRVSSYLVKAYQIYACCCGDSKSVAGSRFSEDYSLLLVQDFLKIILCCWYVVSTGSVIVPTGRYIVPTGSIIVTTGRYVVPAGNSYIYDPNPNSFDCPPYSCHPSHPTYETHSYDSYGNNSQFGYDCQPQFPLNYESEQGCNENYNSYPYDSSSLPQQYPCCTRYSYDSNSLGFDQPQPPQSSVIHQPPQELSIQEMEDLKRQYLDELKHLSNLEYRVEIKIAELTENFNDQFEDFSESNEDFSSINNDSFSIDNIDYVEASPLDYELVSSEVMEIVIPKVKEISSGSPTTHSDSSLYASFIIDLSINPFPPTDRRDFYEFTDELIPFISPPEYDCFLFKVEPNSGDFTKDMVEDISPTKEPQVHNTLSTHPFLQLNMKFQPSSESLFTYIVWLFVLFLVYSVAPHYLLSLRNEDAIFDPSIYNSTFSRPDVSHRCETVKKFNTHHSHLNGCPILIHG
nr:ribonuclease H-like domain-containing protein [Tanacetum cinerariifolium]